MQGQQFPSEHSVSRDKATGAVIHQMTRHPSINHAPYFLTSAFTPDNRTLIFTSYRSGCPHLYEVRFPDGPIRQLTTGRAVHPFSAVIHPDGHRVFFVRGGSVWVVDCLTFEERRIIEFPDAQFGECSLSSDGDWVATACKQGDQHGIALGRTNGQDWTLLPFPRTVIHPQWHPKEPGWLIFSGDPAPRMYRIRRDGSALECLYENGNDEFIVHETFLGETGDVIYVRWPGSLHRLNWRTKESTQIASCAAWHISSNKEGTRILCDTNHPNTGLWLVDANNGQQGQLCLSESSNQGTQWKESRYALPEDFARASKDRAANLSWMEVPVEPVYGPQWTHPHPSFSPDETKVVFTSDRSGHPQVYVAEVPQF